MGILAVIVKTWRWLEDTKGLRVPVAEKLLNAPGESARKHKEELDDKVMDAYLWVLGLPLTLLAWYFGATRGVIAPSAGFWVTVMLLATLGYGALLVRLIGLLEMRAQWRLNLSAEKAMGEELNRLMAEGCLVFHDFPLEKNANIDHIVVAPSGVFAIETKTWRKNPSPTNQQKLNEVVYDGKRLQFPGYAD
ncbi:MAG: nuclease [Pedosphaera sp.]|nr:nuclease [Pedosphaera sp.]